MYLEADCPQVAVKVLKCYFYWILNVRLHPVDDLLVPHTQFQLCCLAWFLYRGEFPRTFYTQPVH